MRNLIFTLAFFSSLSAISNPKEFSFDWIKLYPKNDYHNFDWTVLPKGFTREMAMELINNPSINSPNAITILVMEGELIALLPCRFDVLRWNGNAWINLYIGNASGFNCKAYFFVKDKKLYSFGTYGFWKNHSELLEFDFLTGGWENIQVENMPLDYGGNTNFISGTQLITILGNYVNQSAQKYKFEPNGYHLDLKTKKWSKLEIELPNQESQDNLNLVYFNLKDFVFIYHFRYLAADGPMVIDKSNYSIHFLNKFYPHDENQLGLVYSKENKLWIHQVTNSYLIFDLEEGFQQFKQVGQIILGTDKNNMVPISNLHKILFLLLALVIIGASVFFIVRKKQSTVNQKEISPNLEAKITEKERNLIILELIKLNGKTITGEELDDILGIQTIPNIDSKRAMRSKHLKSINELNQKKTGKTLIQRLKSEDDKRIILYTILQQ